MTDSTVFPVTVTQAAADKAWSLLASEGREDLSLRIEVSPGGCSGLIYRFYFDDRTFEDDLQTNVDELQIVVDAMSAPYLEGSTLDFQDTLQAQGFSIDNPNAAGTCACGDSFH